MELTDEKTVLHVFPASADNDFPIGCLEDIYVPMIPEFSINKATIRKEQAKHGKASRRRPRPTREHTFLKKRPQQITCPNCLGCVETKVSYFSTSATHILAVGLLPVGMCMLPYSMKKFRDAAHFCPDCDIFIGISFGAAKKSFLSWGRSTYASASILPM